MSKQADLISIIMPLYNCEDFVAESINSVISQTYTKWELIVVDDQSTDYSYKIVEKLSKNESRIKLYQMPTNSGVAKVRNFAIEKSLGRYIAFLDSDDLWTEKKLESQLLFMQEKELSFSFTAFIPINEDNTETKKVNRVPKQLTYNQLLKRTVIGCLTVMYDISKIGKCYFDVTLSKHEDYQCWLEILKKIPYAGGLDESLAYYRIRESSVSSNKVVAASYVWKILYKYQKIPFYKAVYYFSHYAVKAFLKHRER